MIVVVVVVGDLERYLRWVCFFGGLATMMITGE